MEKEQTITLDTQAVFQIGDTTIIASACYQEEGQSCFDKIADILREEMGNLVFRR